MDVPKVPPRPASVDQLQQVLDSPEVARLIRTLEYIRWTGRKGYPPRAMVGMCLVKSLYGLPTWTRAVRLVAEHAGLQAVLGCAPSQWACYRFARMLRDRDRWALQACMNDVLAALRQQHPDLGRGVAIDASDLPAYANGQREHHDGRPSKSSDPDASWGHRSAVSTHGKGAFYGYKIDAAVDVTTGLPLAWIIRSGRHQERGSVFPLLDRVKALGFDVQTAAMDKGYDHRRIHSGCMERGIAPVIPIKDTQAVLRGAAEPPHCAHGQWTFAGADFKRKATKWRCPTGECKPASMWRKADRFRPLIPRETKRYRELYAQRSRVEGEFGYLKHEWSLLPLRVRGLGRVRLHADLTILARLACSLSNTRARTALLAA